jgi:hypothetical protein
MEPRVSATLVLDQIRLMKDLHGEAMVAESIASLPAAVREELEGLLPGGWCSVDTPRALKQAIADRLGEPLLLLQRRTVRAGVERTLHSVWRFFIRRISDDQLIRRAPLLYARSFDRGELRFVSVVDRVATFELHGWPTIPEFDVVGLAGGIEAVLLSAGRVEPHVSTTRRGPVVRFRCVWKPSQK